MRRDARPTWSRSRPSTTCFELEPVGRAHGLRLHEHLAARCAAPTSCSTRSAEATGAPISGSSRRRASAARFECLGACDIAPMASIDERYFGPLDGGRRAGGRRAAARRRRACCPTSALREPPRRRRPGRPRRRGRRLPETRVLLPATSTSRGSTAIEATERLGGYRALRKALTRDGARRGAAASSRTRACAAAAAPASRWARRPRFLPARRRWTSTSCCNADESEPGHLQGPRADAEEPAPADRGDRRSPRSPPAPTTRFIFIRGEYDEQADILDARRRRGLRGRLPRREHPRHRHRVELVVHRGAGAYICGEETALLDSLEGKRGNPRLKPPFPADPGPLRRARR